MVGQRQQGREIQANRTISNYLHFTRVENFGDKIPMSTSVILKINVSGSGRVVCGRPRRHLRLGTLLAAGCWPESPMFFIQPLWPNGRLRLCLSLSLTTLPQVIEVLVKPSKASISCRIVLLHKVAVLDHWGRREVRPAPRPRLLSMIMIYGARWQARPSIWYSRFA